MATDAVLRAFDSIGWSVWALTVLCWISGLPGDTLPSHFLSPVGRVGPLPIYTVLQRHLVNGSWSRFPLAQSQEHWIKSFQMSAGVPAGSLGMLLML